jgi:hypothetical protein
MLSANSGECVKRRSHGKGRKQYSGPMARRKLEDACFELATGRSSQLIHNIAYSLETNDRRPEVLPV